MAMVSCCCRRQWLLLLRSLGRMPPDRLVHAADGLMGLLALTLVLYACYGWLSREDAVRLS